MTLAERLDQEDRAEALEALKKQGGLDGCGLAFAKDQAARGSIAPQGRTGQAVP
jgi:hypothetical protein